MEKRFIPADNLNSLIPTINILKTKNIGSILDYSIEQSLYSKKKKSNSDYNRIMTIFLENIIFSRKHHLKIIAIKISSIIDPEILTGIKNLSDLPDIEYSRIKTIFNAVSLSDIKITVDAEQSDIQVGISKLTLDLMKIYNQEKPMIYNTYQSYLKSTPETFLNDYLFSKKNNFIFAFKLVRGAYLDLEDKSKIVSTKEITDNIYEKILHFSLKKKLPIIIATHNKESIKFAVKIINQEKLEKKDVWFAQLYGLSDNLTEFLGKNNFSVFKYIPYGKKEETLPYVSRRISELKFRSV